MCEYPVGLLVTNRRPTVPRRGSARGYTCQPAVAIVTLLPTDSFRYASPVRPMASAVKGRRACNRKWPALLPLRAPSIP
jgi:hypothetical protein